MEEEGSLPRVLMFDFEESEWKNSSGELSISKNVLTEECRKTTKSKIFVTDLFMNFQRLQNKSAKSSMDIDLINSIMVW